MINPTTNRGAGPCLVGQTQKGAYFAGNRAHVIISKYSLVTHMKCLNKAINFKDTSHKISYKALFLPSEVSSVCLFLLLSPHYFSQNQTFRKLPVLTRTLWSVFQISDDSFVLDSTVELLFSIRPQSPTGLLLHVGVFSRSQSTGHYLSVYMLRGEVRPDQKQSRVHRTGFTRK